MRSRRVRGYIDKRRDVAGVEGFLTSSAHCDRAAVGLVDGEPPLYKDSDLSPEGAGKRHGLAPAGGRLRGSWFLDR